MNDTLFLDILLGSAHKQFQFLYCLMQDCYWGAFLSQWYSSKSITGKKQFHNKLRDTNDDGSLAGTAKQASDKAKKIGAFSPLAQLRITID